MLHQSDSSSKTFNSTVNKFVVLFHKDIMLISRLMFQEKSNRILAAIGFTKRFVDHALPIKWIIINSCFVTAKVAKLLDISEQVLNYLLSKIFQENVFKIEINFFFSFQMSIARNIKNFFHQQGIHSTTVQVYLSETEEILN